LRQRLVVLRRILAPYGQGELAVAKVFTLLLIISDLFLLAFSSREDNPLTGNRDRIRCRGKEAEEGHKSIPFRNIKVFVVDEVGGQLGSISSRNIGSRGHIGVLAGPSMTRWIRSALTTPRQLNKAGQEITTS